MRHQRLTDRTNFRINLLKNPNYYGTYPGLGPVVNATQFDTSFEQLQCLGLSQGGAEFTVAEGTLEAIVQINQSDGYDSGPCGSGSTEWVRFYVQDGATWTDAGVTGVTVYNLAGSALPVCYAVSLNIENPGRWCTVENVVNVRAILSWEFQPPANTPNFVPVFGNVVNSRVQIAPVWFDHVPLNSLIDGGLVKLDPSVADVVDLAETLPGKTPQPLSYAALKALYAGTSVPAHRFGFSAAHAVQQKPLEKVLFTAAAAGSIPSTAANLTAGADLTAILNEIANQNGNTDFEQLTCAGYNPQTRTLEAVIEIKLNNGFSGSLCTAGSYEYVSFFAYFGSAWNALGTAQVNVHDLASVTAGNPIYYAVARLSGVTSELCETLTSVPLRAILSWEAIPTSENYVPVWGNVIDTNIQPQIGAATEGESARILRINDVGVIGIASSLNAALLGDYLANDDGIAGDCQPAYGDSPFGEEVFFEGSFYPMPSGVFDPVKGTVLPGAHPIIYQAWITPPSGPAFQLTNSFNLGVFPSNAPISAPEVSIGQVAQTAIYGPVSGGAPTDLYYTYYESADGQLVNPRTVADFLAGAYPAGNYTFVLNGFSWDGAMYQPMPAVSQPFYLYNGYQLNSGHPLVSIGLTSAPDCGNVTAGTPIAGSYSVADDFFGVVTIAMTQVYIGGVPIPMPPVVLSNFNDGVESVVYDGTNTGGTSGTFTIDTTGLPPCGYTIQLTAWDRALNGTNCYGNDTQEAVGFCLVPNPAN
jgi:hypothetical protein